MSPLGSCFCTLDRVELFRESITGRVGLEVDSLALILSFSLFTVLLCEGKTATELSVVKYCVSLAAWIVLSNNEPGYTCPQVSSDQVFGHSVRKGTHPGACAFNSSLLSQSSLMGRFTVPVGLKGS